MTLTLTTFACDSCGRASDCSPCSECRVRVTCPTCSASVQLSALQIEEPLSRPHELTERQWRAGMDLRRVPQVAVCYSPGCAGVMR